METEDKKTDTKADPAKGHPAIPQDAPPAISGDGFQKLVIKATEFTFLVVFIFYSIGFLTWQSYLSKYGASPIGFLQAEYLSAAFCYLFVSVTLAGPPIVLSKHWMNSRAGKPKNVSLDIPFIMVMLWVLLALRFSTAFFFDPWRLSRIEHYCIVALTLLIMAFGAVYVVCATKYREARLTKWLARYVSITIFPLLAVILLLLMTGLPKWFLFSTLLGYCVLAYMIIGWRQAWAKFNLMVRALMVCVVCYAIISHIQNFGSSVFGLIPRRIGGGKPETAFVKLATQHQDLISAFNLPTTNNVGVSNGFVGPISVLLRSEKEILFVNFADLGVSANLSNVVTNVVTNVTTNRTTNSISFTTNRTMTFTTNVLKNTTRIRAKQIRADLVDALIFEQ